jgi:hypothetical protein
MFEAEMNQVSEKARACSIPLDALDHLTGVTPPAEVFDRCPRCRAEEPLKFEGEVFCLKCSWDSVDIHAEALAAAQIYQCQARANRKCGEQREKAQGMPSVRVSPQAKLLWNPDRVNEAGAANQRSSVA